MKKKLMAVLAAGALTALTATSALALENEFHGMFKTMMYETNFFNGFSGHLDQNAGSGFFAEQRARLQYIAKANDDLKLVTHFELDARFGGKSGTYLGAGNDAGNLDADQVTFETKNIYLDFNCPITKANVKLGIQPWADSYKSLFLLADMSGVYVSKKFDPLTVSLGWFRLDDNGLNTTGASSSLADDDGFPGKLTADMYVLDAKYAATKDMTFGASYYYIDNNTTVDVPGAVAIADTNSANINDVSKLHMLGLNASLKFDPLTIEPFFAYQFGDNPAGDLDAYLAGATAKVKIGTTGAVNLAAIYLSGDDNAADRDIESFTEVSRFTSYFNPANMWLLVRSGQAINSSTSVLANDLTVGGRGLLGFFGGYEGSVGKVFYNANIGYAMAAEERTNEDAEIGTEINAQVGYKLYDNLSVSLTGAYAVLGDGMTSTTERMSGFGANNADDPWLANLQFSYIF